MSCLPRSSGHLSNSRTCQVFVRCVSHRDTDYEGGNEQPGHHGRSLHNPVCVLGTKLIAKWEVRAQTQLLDRLFDGEYLRLWWGTAGIETLELRGDHLDEGVIVASSPPDVLVSLSGTFLPQGSAAFARVAALAVHITNIPRVECIGAFIEASDRSHLQPRLIWQEAPHVAPGDTGNILVLKAHVQAARAVLRLLRMYQHGEVPPNWEPRPETAKVPATLHLSDWIKYVVTARGRRGRFCYERAVRT